MLRFQERSLKHWKSKEREATVFEENSLRFSSLEFAPVFSRGEVLYRPPSVQTCDLPWPKAAFIAGGALFQSTQNTSQ
eukprot:5554389-Amphidinium_carterae.1